MIEVTSKEIAEELESYRAYANALQMRRILETTIQFMKHFFLALRSKTIVNYITKEHLFVGSYNIKTFVLKYLGASVSPVAKIKSPPKHLNF